jgi:hypothetical protein
MGTRPEEWRRQYYSVADFPVTHDGLKQGCKQKAGNGEGKAIAGKHAFRKVYTGEALGPFTSILSIRTPLKPLLRANSLMSLLLPGS